MKINLFTRVLCAIMLITTISARVVRAQALPASDNAGDPVYINGGWLSGTNGGYGFQPWYMFKNGSSTGVGKFFLADSTHNGFQDGPGINTSGLAFGEGATLGLQTTAVRPFSGSLAAGQTFSMDFDNGFINSGQAAGFYLADPNGVGRFTMLFSGGGNEYILLDANGTTHTGLPFTSGGLHADFTLTGPTSYSFTLRELGSNASFTGTGTIASGVDRIAIFDNNAGGGGDHFVFANNLKITAVPPSYVTWSAPRQITGDADVDTTGTLDRAYHFADNSESTPAINGVTFRPFILQGTDNSTFETLVNAAFGYPAAPYSNTSPAYQSILANGFYNTSRLPGTITLNHLTPGASYEVQVWVNDSRALGRNESVSGSPTLLYDTTNTPGGLGHYIIGTFIANAAGSQTLTFVPGPTSVAQINGLQLRVLSPTLSGAIEFSTDNIGNGTSQAYSTGLGGYYLYVKQGNTFINASNGTVFLPLAPGTNTFELRGDGTGAADLGKYGLNLFFGGNTITPAISVFGPEGVSGNPTPPFATNSASGTYGGGGLTKGAGTTTFTMGNYQVTLSDYYWQSPSVQDINEVGEYNIGPGGGPDFTGHFTLTVTPLSPQITSVSPSVIPAGGPDFTLDVKGIAFTPGTAVMWNGSVRTTTFVSPTELLAAIPASDIVKPGNATVSVIGTNGVITSTVSVTVAPPSLQTTFTLSRDLVSQEVLVTLTLSNTGGGYANNVSLAVATLQTSAPTSPGLPLMLGTITPGGNITTVLRYPASITAGASTLKLSGASASGSFGGTYRVTIP